MSEVENNCRVCRGEGTLSQPLLHPCKCRGSIKYIHQDCLLEWLKHSNKSTKKCDICNTPYKFRTIYDPQMPERIPIKYIWGKFLEVVSSTTIKSLSILLYITCLIIQVPLFWKFMGRIATWAIDGTLPRANPTFLEALLFGELDFLNYDLPSSTTKVFLFKLRKFVDYTYFSGIRYILMYVIIHLALFVEHEWVVRDEGYTKLLLRKIGKEPRAKLVDMLQQALSGLRNDGEAGNAEANDNVQRLEMIARAINDLQEQPNNGQHEELLRRAIEQDDRQNNERENVENVNPNLFNHENGVEQNVRDPTDDEVELNDERRTIYLRPETEQNQDQQNQVDGHLNGEYHEEQRDEVRNGNAEDLLAQADQRIDQNDLFEQNPFEEVNEMNMDDAEDDLNGGGGDILQLLGMSLNLSSPIFLMVMCDVIICIYLFVTYLFPHMLGSLFAITTGMTLRLLNSVVFKRVYPTSLIEKFNSIIFMDNDKIQKTGNDFLDFTLFTVFEVIVKPLSSTFRRLIIDQDLSQPTLIERIILLTIGYSIIAFVVYKFMNSLISGAKPVMGTPRKLYKILFEVASTTKVFIIFAIEIFFFPVYCGWLLDFCIAPILLSHFSSISDDGSVTFTILLSSELEVLQIHYIRVVLYWLSGTLYMLFFALFVGMIRGQVLRPGVLFFIRSPDDPNARLIHDALMKPLMLQLSRIYLSAKVYTGFILIGIGGVTWGLRYLVTPPKDITYNVMLPLQIPSVMSVAITCIAVGDIILNKPLITAYCQSYWARIFEISAHKLRLSHFILGKPIAQERGYIVYRSAFHKLLGLSQPDYSNPVTYRDALRIFKTDNLVNACFVPDGNYVRAPDNDTVTRKFIKKLFVSVTKDDKLLSSNETQDSNKNGYETDSDDDEINTDDAYTIVYRPPNFKLRCLGLICMLWVFSVILILGIIFAGLIIGRPVIKAFTILLDLTITTEKSLDIYNTLFTLTEFDWRLADISSIFIGIKFELAVLKFIDDRTKLATDTGVNNEVNVEGIGEVRNDEQGIMALGRNFVPRFGQVIVASFIVYSLSSVLWILWVLSVHKFCIDLPLRMYTDNVYNNDNPGHVLMEFLLTKTAVVIHLIAGFWTVVPFCLYFTVDLRNGMLNGLGFRDSIWKSGLSTILINFGIVHVPAILYTLFKHRQESLDSMMLEGNDAYVWCVTLACFIAIKLVTGANRLINRINEQVKNERYVKGRAIENIDIPDEQ
ncbi:uncharacterized protein AC631_02003 [Debaryomyces fabryi]|uniref:RING-type E3 ubiquitin transferase n=1 Tax=Debaryomyces fabryi TaxID=58627 RepID=A0A0V1Q181_9ASCO|nr:uncharacterized protein AC631_02003 [Debaryomyces fabryi]KSA02267.1 hypothetical protein AC631_02003 [Debaryomyces fabryi]CUM46852.1 unnamed protein product [Debaryomyces fabryi]